MADHGLTIAGSLDGVLSAFCAGNVVENLELDQKNLFLHTKCQIA